MSAGPITYVELARRVYGTPEPSRAQLEAVGRACRRLAGTRDLVELVTVRERAPRGPDGSTVVERGAVRHRASEPRQRPAAAPGRRRAPSLRDTWAR